MMRNSFATRLLLLSVLAGGFETATAATANAAEPPTVPPVSAGRGLLEWVPPVESEGMTLTLADPQGVIRTHHFSQGEAPALSLFDAQGAPLPDGTYTWELRVTPRGTAPLVQSGYFTISGGNLVAPDLSEPSAESLRVATAPDQMVPDDLIVDGKSCIGLGCNNNEAFSAEALRLKQSVVRLRFEDTSSQAGFPSRDWQLAVNDSASGGADRFSIEDLTAGTAPFTLRGGAPNNSLFVDANGRVGIGTAAPAASLSLVGAANFDAVMRVRNTSNTGYSGIEFIDHAGTPRFFFGVNNNNSTTRLNSFSSTPFLLLTDSVERVRIEPGGNVSLGCTSPTARLVLGGFGASCGAAPFSSINPGAATFTTSSSRTYKENLRSVDIPDVLHRIAGVGVYTYDFIGGPKDRLGLVAEDFHRIFGRGSDKVIEGGEIEMALWLAVQHLGRRNQELEARNEDFEKRLAAIEASLQERP